MKRVLGLAIIVTCCVLVECGQAAPLIVASGEICELWGNVEYDSVTVQSGGVIRTTPLHDTGTDWEGGWLNLLATQIQVEEGGLITASAAGYGTLTGGGPGVGGSNNNNRPQYISGSGGGYGGQGGDYLWTAGSGGATYGSVEEMDGALGSAGGFYYYVVSAMLDIWCFREGGAGGGFLRLAADDITINGTVSSNGGSGLKAAFPYTGILQYGSGGGSGGELVIDAWNSLQVGLTGLVQAKGGDGSSPGDVDSSGGGGGGRIKVRVNSPLYSNSGRTECPGGSGGDHLADGEPGTVFIETAVPPQATAFSLLGASAPAVSNYGQIGAFRGFSTTIDEALSEDEGMVYSIKSPGAASHTTFLNKGETASYGIGERSLQSQVVYLRAPVKRVDTNGDFIIDENDTGWVPLALGHEIGQPPLERQRDLTSTVGGSFRVNADISDLQMRLTASGSMDSYTIASLVVNGSTAYDAFEAVKDLIWEPKAETALAKAGAHFAAIATVELILDPASEYAGEVSFGFAAGTASGSGTVIATSGFQQNLVGWTARTRRTEDLTLGAMPVSAGDVINWSADFRTMVETRGYAKVDAQLESYRVEALAGGEIIGVVHSWQDPIGGSSGTHMMAMAAADLNGDGIPDQPTGDQDLLNNRFFEEEVIADLTYGQVALVDSAGSVLPTSGVAMVQIDGNADTAGFITKLTMPVDAETMYLDCQLLASADAGISPETVLALAIYDESGHVSFGEILPSGLALLILDEAAGTYAYGSGWLTAELDLTGMDPEVYFVVAFDTENVAGMDLGVALDNLRTFGAPIPEPATLSLLALGGLGVLLRKRGV